MISDVKNYPISVLFDIDAKIVYTIPRYQREYTWSRWNWEALFDDVLECDSAYFLGSIICINQSKDALDIQELELVDGQQRMTTISLMFLALYATLKEHEEEMDEDQRVELVNLKNRLLIKKTERTRVNPQHQNFNNDDYRFLVAKQGLLKNIPQPKNAGNRKIHKCYRYFMTRIDEYLDKQPDYLDSLLKLLEKFLTASIVKIQVESHADAYTLFESLNNRGVPLTPIDIIKNKLLAELEKIEPESIGHNFNNWQALLEYLGDDYGVQERFFRQYYNAFKNDLAAVIEVPVATKSNMIRIYEKLIREDPQGFIDRVTDAGKLYALILGRCMDESQAEQFSSLQDPYKSLERIQGAPAYLMLMHLLTYRDRYALQPEHFSRITKQLVAFFVRRNITDFPPTYDLTRLFMQIVDQLQTSRQSSANGHVITGDKIVSRTLACLAANAASDDLFEEKLSGQIYDENSWATRFILCALEEQSMTKETKRDLWRYENKQYVWTIEHVFPQGDNIPKAWVDMIAAGDASKAKEYQDKYVHQLGNLTISGYNSALGNKSFVEKRDRQKDGSPVGYRNGLWLNEELAEAESWSIEQIQERTNALVHQVLGLFKMDRGEE